MSPFQFATAGSPDEAVSLIGQNGRYLGGGIDLLGEMKEYIVTPDILVSVKGVSADAPPVKLPLGAAETPMCHLHGNITVTEIAADQNLKSTLNGLTEAASEVGSPQIRNVATLAGNLLQHSRCWYYRQPDITCLKRGGSTCYGTAGENKYLSLFSGNACISPIVSNLATMLTALDATVWVQRNGSLGMMTMAELYDKAWKDSAAHHSLEPQAFLVNVTVPYARKRSAYRQVSEKNEFDWALVSCGAAGNITDGKITDARVALGAVAPVPYTVDAAHAFLEGKSLTDETVAQAADIILKDAKPLAHNGYKVPLARALIRRTLLALNT